MRRLFLPIMVLSIMPIGAALGDAGVIVQYDCEKPVCRLMCAGKNTNLALTYKTLRVFQLKDQPGRLWVAADDAQYPIAADATCKFEGNATFGR